MESYSAIKKEWKSDILNNMGKIQRHYAERSRHKHTYSVIPFTGISRKSRTNLRWNKRLSKESEDNDNIHDSTAFNMNDPIFPKSKHIWQRMK